MRKINVRPNHIPFKMRHKLSDGKQYEATQIARDMYTITTDDGENLTIAVGRNCMHLSERKWVRC